MAYANARVQSLGATTSPRQASLIDGHRFASRNAVRARLPCGCLTHKHSCRKHAVTAAHARCQGSTSVGALSTACPATPQSCKGVNGQLFASAARPSKRSASVHVVRARTAQGEVEETASGFLGTRDQQRSAYGLLAVLWGAIAAAKILATEQFFEHVFGIAGAHVGELGLQRLSGFSALAPAVAAYTLVKAAKGGRLSEHQYLRQNLGLAVTGVMTLFYLWKTPAMVLEPVYQKLAAGLAAFTAIVGGAVYSQTSGHKFSIPKIAEGFGNSLAALISPENASSAIYSLLSAALGIYSMVLLFGSHELAAQWLVIGGSDVSLYLQREIGLSTFLGAIQTFCLKDAADQGTLDKPTFKNLNLGLAAIAAGNASSLWWAVNAAKLVSWTTQSYTRMAFLALQVITYSYNWIESDREEQIKDVVQGHEKAHHGQGMKSALANQNQPSRSSSRSLTGATTRNVQDFKEANEDFQDEFESGHLPAPPARKLAVVTCMDARLHPEAFMGFGFGDAHMIRNAGGRVSDDALRSLVISQRMLGTEEVVVIHHTECGMMTLKNEAVYDAVEGKLGSEAKQSITGKDFMPIGTDLNLSVKRDMDAVKNYKAIPKDTPVHGFIYDVKNGALIPVDA